MKIKLRRKFKYTWDHRKVLEILPGTYEVPRQVDKKAAQLALSLGQAVIVSEPKVDKEKTKVAEKKPKITKKAPENKVVKVESNK